jgi:hypothetical protein
MKGSPSWEADSHSAIQEISRLQWNTKVHYRGYMSPPLILILSQMHPVHTLPPCCLKIYYNIILPFKLSSSQWSLPYCFATTSLYEFFISSIRVTSHSFDMMTVIIFGEAYNLWSSSLYSLLQFPTTFSPLMSNYSSQNPFLKRPQSLFFL